MTLPSGTPPPKQTALGVLLAIVGLVVLVLVCYALVGPR